jgi:hypothetical protein
MVVENDGTEDGRIVADLIFDEAEAQFIADAFNRRQEGS